VTLVIRRITACDEFPQLWEDLHKGLKSITRWARAIEHGRGSAVRMAAHMHPHRGHNLHEMLRLLGDTGFEEITNYSTLCIRLVKVVDALLPQEG
jgi:hypothetical protein